MMAFSKVFKCFFVAIVPPDLSVMIDVLLENAFDSASYQLVLFTVLGM